MNLPLEITSFTKWVLITLPKKIFTICYRILIVTNNEFGFSLNLGLLFTPIFGDYTFIGRLIGFIFRLIQIISTAIIMLGILVFTIVAPILFILTPIIVSFINPLLVIPILIFLYFYWKSQRANLAVKKISQLLPSEITESFRPSTKILFDSIQSDYNVGLNKFSEDPSIKYLLKKSELTNPELFSKLSQLPFFDKSPLAQNTLEVAKKQSSTYVEIEQLFVAFLTLIPKINVILSTYGSSLEDIEGCCKWIVMERNKLEKVYIWQDDYELPSIGGIGRTMTGRVTPDLDRISEDFTLIAKKTPNKRYVAHKKEIDSIAEILSGSKGNVLIVGEPGSGKTSIMRNLAYEITRGTKYKALKFKRIVNIQIDKLIAGSKNSGELVLRLKRAMDDVSKSGDVIVFIDEIHNIVAGNENEESSSAVIFSTLESYLTTDKIQFVGATNIQNYRKHIEPNGSFARIFQTVEIPPSTKEETLEVIKVIATEKEKENGIFITFPALTKILDLSNKLIQERVFPDKAIDILIRSISSQKNNQTLDKDLITKVVSEITKVPLENLTEDEFNKLQNIEAELKTRVIGQDEAISQVVKALKRARVGIRNENKPISSFLFVGTTGVGKTETAKALAKNYFGDSKKMIRLDMSEYQQIDSINKLIGSPDGTMKGTLTESVRTNPFSLILLDEIEKAYASVLLAFLQVLDDGRLTDTSGHTVDFTNTIIIATSNVGTRAIQEISERNGTFEEMSEKAMSEVRSKYAPEFLNRFNGIIVYKPLSKESVTKIADLMLKNIVGVSKSKGINVSFKPELIEKLIEKGFSPEWGARPLARVIEDTVETYIASKMISKELKMGDEIEIGLEALQ